MDFQALSLDDLLAFDYSELGIEELEALNVALGVKKDEIHEARLPIVARYNQLVAERNAAIKSGDYTVEQLEQMLDAKKRGQDQVVIIQKATLEGEGPEDE